MANAIDHMRTHFPHAFGNHVALVVSAIARLAQFCCCKNEQHNKQASPSRRRCHWRVQYHTSTPKSRFRIWRAQARASADRPEAFPGARCNARTASCAPGDTPVTDFAVLLGRVLLLQRQPCTAWRLWGAQSFAPLYGMASVWREQCSPLCGMASVRPAQ